MTVTVDPPSESPETAMLTAMLERLLEDLRHAGVPALRLEIVPGRSRLRSGSHPNETIMCEMEDASRLPLFLKYSRHHLGSGNGHRGGLRRESEVYRRLLQGFPGSRPKLLATGEVPKHGITYLLLEELQGTLRLSKTTPENMVRAAKWIGRFHARYETPHENGGRLFLPSYDRSYYSQWSRRALELTRSLHSEHPRLGAIARFYERDAIPVLLDSAQTAVHGEFYSKNILTKGPRIYPVDWESAAIAAGEVDLASLTEGWSEDIQRSCADGYRAARWPAGSPKSFEVAIEAARFYFLFRWLGNGPYFATGKRGRQRLDALEALADRSRLTQQGAALR